MFPQLKKNFMKKVLKKDPNLASWIPQEVDRVAKAPPRDRMSYDTLESFMTERLRDVSMKFVRRPFSLRGPTQLSFADGSTIYALMEWT